MRLYHASTSKIEKPDVLHSRDKLDFGKGFYLTAIREQAVRYAERFTRRGKDAFINEYELARKRQTSSPSPSQVTTRNGSTMLPFAGRERRRSKRTMLWLAVWQTTKCLIPLTFILLALFPKTKRWGD